MTAAFLLFAVIYLAFPNTEPRFRLGTIWPGAAIAAVLFELLTSSWPLYAHFAHFSRYVTVLFPLLVLTAWIYFFCMILLVGAEVVAIRALREARVRGSRLVRRRTERRPNMGQPHRIKLNRSRCRTRPRSSRSTIAPNSIEGGITHGRTTSRPDESGPWRSVAVADSSCRITSGSNGAASKDSPKCHAKESFP